MPRQHPRIEDYEYWDLRLRLFDLQRQSPMDDAIYDELKRDLIDDLNTYLITHAEEQDPWD